jgi:hypothetical protein
LQKSHTISFVGVVKFVSAIVTVTLGKLKSSLSSITKGHTLSFGVPKMRSSQEYGQRNEFGQRNGQPFAKDPGVTSLQSAESNGFLIKSNPCG